MENNGESAWSRMGCEDFNGRRVAIITENKNKDQALWREGWENILGGESKAKPLKKERPLHFSGTERKLGWQSSAAVGMFGDSQSESKSSRAHYGVLC